MARRGPLSGINALVRRLDAVVEPRPFATMVIFGAGVVTGGLLVRHSERIRPIRSHLTTNSRVTAAPSPGGMRLEFLRRMQRELDLTPVQKEKVDGIVSASQDRIKVLMEPVAPQLRQELQRAKEEFRETLTPEQRKRFDELVKQQHAHERRSGGNRERSEAPAPAETTGPTNR